MYGGGRSWESLLLLYRAPQGNGGGRLGLISTKCGQSQENILSNSILVGPVIPNHPKSAQHSFQRSMASAVGEEVETWDLPLILPGGLALLSRL